MNELQCTIYPFGTKTPLRFVAVCSFFQGKYLLSRHKERTTWETQGGHIEQGETAMEAAVRELFEESGASGTLYPLCDYKGYIGERFAYGAVFLADIKEIGSLPESEMAEAMLFDALPKELTDPFVTPVFFEEAKKLVEILHIIKKDEL